jgi:ketosteroid isomerase-like protein
MGQTEDEIRELLRRWAGAVERNDVEALGELMAEDLIHTDPTGAVHTREQVLAGLALAPDIPCESVGVEDVLLRIYDNVALANGYTEIKARVGGQTVTGRFRFTDVFHKRNGDWKIVATHTTAVTRA